MFLWLIRQLLSIRQVIAGRNHPHQLAWGLALGVLVGVVPHGNLLAIALIAVVLTFRINHAMATLTGVAVAFSATRLDPYTHQLGRYVLTHPDLQATWMQLWQLPLVPWTDLNNTVVLGSLLVGLAAVLPAYAVSYPIFRYFAPPPAAPPEAPEPEPATAQSALPAAASALVVAESSGPTDSPVGGESPPTDGGERQRRAAAANAPDAAKAPAIGKVHTLAKASVPPAATTAAVPPSRAATGGDQGDLVVMETQIDVIRLKDYGRDGTATGKPGDAAPQAVPADQAQMNQALGYLLRRIRDSQQGKAA